MTCWRPSLVKLRVSVIVVEVWGLKKSKRQLTEAAGKETSCCQCLLLAIPVLLISDGTSSESRSFLYVAETHSRMSLLSSFTGSPEFLSPCPCASQFVSSGVCSVFGAHRWPHVCCTSRVRGDKEVCQFCAFS